MKRRFSLKKASLDLLVLFCLAAAIWIGYRLFYLHELPSVIGSVLFIGDVIIIIWSIWLLRSIRYKTRTPGFLLVLSSVLAVFLVLAFAGVEPVSAAKAKITNWIGVQTASITKTTIVGQTAKQNTPTTGLKLTSDYSKTYPAYEQDLGGGLKLYSKIPIPPPIKVWNYEIDTSSRVYYAVNVKKTSEGVTMIGFWATEGDNWKFNNIEWFMEYKYFGNISISNAPAYQIR